jgi:hypothetical protein
MVRTPRISGSLEAMNSLERAAHAAERETLRRALVAENGNRGRAAKRLGMSRYVLRRAIARHPELLKLHPSSRGRPRGAKDLKPRKKPVASVRPRKAVN